LKFILELFDRREKSTVAEESFC